DRDPRAPPAARPRRRDDPSDRRDRDAGLAAGPEPALDLSREMRSRQRLARRLLDQPVPADGLPRREDALGEERPGLGATDEPAGVALERGAQLARDEMPVEVRVVVHRRAGDVDLRGPVWLAASVRRREQLV